MNRLIKCDEVASFSSLEIKSSPIGLGFEKLDRDVFDPEKAYDKVAALGVKWIRIQSGWARTEKAKGVYDFTWLDTIIDNLYSRGMQPWVCLCYGNGLYNEHAAKIFGAVGCPPIFSAEEKKAWHRYVSTLTHRYARKVSWYEVWNEPDGKWCWKHGVNGAEYGEFVKATATAIHEGDPNAKVIGGSTCLPGMKWINDVLRTGAGKCMDALTFHAYSPTEQDCFNRVKALRSLCHSYNPNMKIIQGETGAQSRHDGAGALSQGAWTEERQAKFLARHMISHLLNEVMFTSYFSCMDMIEALNGVVGSKASYLDYGYFGVLRAEFDENGFSTGEYSAKPAYRTLQVIASIFKDNFLLCELPIQFFGQSSQRLLRNDDLHIDLLYGGFRKPDGSCAFCYWKPLELLTTSYEATVSLEIAALPEQIRLVDLLDGSVYELPAKMCEKDGNGFVRLINIPVRDYPLLLTFGNFI